MKMRKSALFCVIVLLCALFSSCQADTQTLNDGYYTAEAAVFDEYGWKEFVTIYINGGKITTVEYDAFNASGFVRSWDMEYMRTMNAISGTYPNEFTRAYAVSLINWQDLGKVSALSGATGSYDSFMLLTDAALKNARLGDNHVSLVYFDK